ncbi:MAG TPA: beta-ketoacyl-[acyl-carrier-protein] synthase family protein [Vicinamibacterales bacterium]|nr:beta-ketoacyl-[acyl-carrier-protein] synthase family protein [Vicinamibacterales bacterium]
MRRVAVTGLGTVSALGVGTRPFWDRLIAGTSGIRRITRFDATGYAAQAAAEVPDFNPSAEEIDDTLRDAVDRFTQFALVAACEAWRESGIQLDDNLAGRAGVILSSAMGGVVSQDDAYVRLYGHKNVRLHPFTVPRVMNNAAASHVSMRLGLRGPTLSTATACAAAAHAIGEASEMIRAGRADVMIAGGADAPIAPGVVRSWEALRVLAPIADDPACTCRPFSRDRSGMVLGEGAGVVVLESWEHASQRGAQILAEVAGYGATADAGHLTQPGVDAPARAIATALAQAQLPADAIGYVNAHGTATRLNDSTETTILKRAFGAHAAALAISSTKAMHGHAMGASAGLEFVATVLALRHGVLPPTINYSEPDPECDLDYVPNTARDAAIGAAISNSFAFGGLNAVLAVKRA